MQYPYLVYDPDNNRYLMIFQYRVDIVDTFHGQFIEYNGGFIGNMFPITYNGTQARSSGAYGNIDKQYLVSWQDKNCYYIHGQRVQANGSFINTDFIISNRSGGQSQDMLAYDPKNRHFLAIFYENPGVETIYGQYINSNGTLYLNGSSENFLIAGGRQGFVAFNPYCGNFMVAYKTGATIMLKQIGPDCVLIPVLQVLPDNFNFGPVVVGTSNGHTFTVTNKGFGPLSISDVTDPDPPFSLFNDTCSMQVLSNSQSCTFDVQIEPTAPGDFSDAFTILSDDPDTPSFQITLNGTGTAPEIMVSDATAPGNGLVVVFGDVFVGETVSHEMVITNNGSASLTIGNIGGSDPLAAPFAIINDECSLESVAPTADCTFKVQFNPVAVGSFSDTFDIPSNSLINETITFNASGNGATQEVADTGIDTGDDIGDDVGETDTGVNLPPTRPELLSPENRATKLSIPVIFVWKRSIDPDGDPVTYDLYYCPNPDFSGCQPEEVVGNISNQLITYAWSLGGTLFIFLGILFGFKRNRKRLFLSGIALAIFLSSTVLTCEKKPEGFSPDYVKFNSIDFHLNTQYYWKVAAKDSQGGTASSDVWSFTTK